MEWWSWVATAASTAVSLAAMSIAVWQAITARTAARSATLQAEHAQRSANAADEQAAQARKSADIAERAHRIEELKILQAALADIRRVQGFAREAVMHALEGDADLAENCATHLARHMERFRDAPLTDNATFFDLAGQSDDLVARIVQQLDNVGHDVSDAAAVGTALRSDETRLAAGCRAIGERLEQKILAARTV